MHRLQTKFKVIIILFFFLFFWVFKSLNSFGASARESSLEPLPTLPPLFLFKNEPRKHDKCFRKVLWKILKTTTAGRPSLKTIMYTGLIQIPFEVDGKPPVAFRGLWIRSFVSRGTAEQIPNVCKGERAYNYYITGTTNL